MSLRQERRAAAPLVVGAATRPSVVAQGATRCTPLLTVTNAVEENYDQNRAEDDSRDDDEDELVQRFLRPLPNYLDTSANKVEDVSYMKL